MSEQMEKGGRKEVNNYKVIVNASGADLLISDIEGLENGLSIPAGATIDLSTVCSREASAASSQLVSAVGAGSITVSSTYTGATEDAAIDAAVGSAHTQGTDQALDTGGPNEVTAADLKVALDTTIPALAPKDTAAVEPDAVVSSQADAATQTGSYVQADVQSIADLANDLKAKYNLAVALLNELKGILNTMNA